MSDRTLFSIVVDGATLVIPCNECIQTLARNLLLVGIFLENLQEWKSRSRGRNLNSPHMIQHAVTEEILHNGSKEASGHLQCSFSLVTHIL